MIHRFDSESWNPLSWIRPGHYQLVIEADTFHGKRLSIGEHSFSLQVKDGDGVMTNIITITDSIRPEVSPADQSESSILTKMFVDVTIAFAVVTVLAAIVTGIRCFRNRKKRDGVGSVTLFM
jgi:hypothetical protein